MMKRSELKKRFSLGLRPQQQWRTIEMVRNSHVRSDPTVSYTNLVSTLPQCSAKIGHTQINVQGMYQLSCSR